MTFRPNMTTEEMQAEDRHRGRQGPPMSPPSIKAPPFKAYRKAMNDEYEEEAEDEMEEDTDMDDMGKALSGLSSYVQKAASYPEDGEPFGKPLPEKKKKKGESEFQHKIRQWSEEVKDRPGRFPGGQKQAVAIAAEQAGVSKKAVQQDALAEMGNPRTGTGIAKSVLDDFVSKAHQDEEDEVEVNVEVEKALNTRSFYIPPPRDSYDPFNIHRSAHTQTTRKHSALHGPEGVAPLVGETFERLFEDEQKRTGPESMTYKSCPVHGISYRVTSSCHPCSVAKSMMCKCGTQMEKSPGGALRCPSCG